MQRLTPDAIKKHLGQGGRILDVREPPVFAEAHVRGSLNVPLSNRSAPYWLSVLVSTDEKLVVITATEREGSLAEQLLEVAERTGIGFAAFEIEAFQKNGVAIASMRTIVPPELAEERQRVAVVDVREAPEWVSGHVPDAVWIPLAELAERVDEVPAGPIATICASGFRSSTAASLLEAAGRTELANVWGGTTAWTQLGYPVNAGREP